MSSVNSPVSEPMTRAARPRTSSAGSGFFLFGIIELPVENASARRTNPKLRVRPPGQLLGEPAEVDHREGRRSHQLDHEVAIGDGIERVGGDAVEAEFAGGRLTVERIAGTGERTRAERGDVGAAPAVGQPAAIALRHLDVGQQVMREEDRLGRLDVGRPGQDGVAVTLGQPDEGPLEADHRVVQPVDRPAQTRAAGRSRPGRCASDRCAASRRSVRSASRAPPRGSDGRLRGWGPRRASRRRPPIAARPARRPASPPRRPSAGRPGPSPWTWATDPARSSSASAASTSTERVNSAIRASLDSLNRPPHSSIGCLRP